MHAPLPGYCETRSPAAASLLIAKLVEQWFQYGDSANTARAHRTDVGAFLAFLGLDWPKEASRLLDVTKRDVRSFRDQMAARGLSRASISRRISSLSSLFAYLIEIGSGLRPPLQVHNPAKGMSPSLQSSPPRATPLTIEAAHRLMTLPGLESMITCRDQAILKTILYSGISVAAACALRVEDVQFHGQEAVLYIRKGKARPRGIWLHPVAADALRVYIEWIASASGPLFRPATRGERNLAPRFMSLSAMHRLLVAYLDKLQESSASISDGSSRLDSLTPAVRSLRATTVRLLLNDGINIVRLKELRGASIISLAM